MFLFLDVISPIPEFYVIEENKVMLNRKILLNESEKLSDNIFQTYVKIDKDINLTKNLKKTALTIGPASFTSLRVGAAFLSGINISKNLPFCPISMNDIFKFKFLINNNKKIGFYLSSANNQNFLCTMTKNKKLNYQKIDELNQDAPTNIETIYYNSKKFYSTSNNFQQIKFSFIEEILLNLNKLNFSKKTIIEPIYISNNTILN